jgi:hypothetical protein
MEQYLNDEDRDRPIAFRASASQILDRLDLLGANERRMHIAAQLLGLEMDPDEWAKRFRSSKSRSETKPLLAYLDGIEYLPGLRLIVSSVDPAADVVLDIGAVVAGGWTGDLWSNLEFADLKVDPRETTRMLRSVDAAEGLPLVVLTEGSTDTEFIGGALEVVYPHLVGYLRFPDFTANRPEANAGRLGQLVRAFAASGVANRVVAAFDNDTAATDVIRTIDQGVLPPNIRIVQYPELALAMAYPTVDNGFASVENVNGHAGSIELYLGADVLADAGNPPVKWGSVVPALGQRQGAIERKRTIQEAFRAKLASARADPAVSSRQDWSGMKAILDEIRRAFD